MGETDESTGPIKEMINTLRERKVINDLTAARWHRLRQVRNRVLHGDVTGPSPGEIHDLVQEVFRIEERNNDMDRSHQTTR